MEQQLNDLLVNGLLSGDDKNLGLISKYKEILSLFKGTSDLILDSIEILINYAQQNSILMDVLNDIKRDLEINLVSNIKKTKETINSLTLKEGDSTTQERDRLLKQGKTQNEIEELLLNKRSERRLMLFLLEKLAQTVGVRILSELQEDSDFLWVHLKNILQEDPTPFKREWKHKEISLFSYCCRHEDEEYKRIFIDSCLDKVFSNLKKEIIEVKKTAHDQLERDIQESRLSASQDLLKLFVVKFKKQIRQVQARDQDTDVETCMQNLLESITILNENTDSIDWWQQPELQQFIRVAADVWSPKFLVLFLKMLCALSFKNSADIAHQAMEDHALGNVSWAVFFKTLDSYLGQLTKGDEFFLQEEEQELIIGFLNLLKTIAEWSTLARRCLVENYKALDSLFVFLNCKLNVEVKAACMGAIASFVKLPINDFDLSDLIWNYLGRSQMLPLTTTTSLGGKFSKIVEFGTKNGLTFDMREIETLLQTYPQTSSFLLLIKNLLECSKVNGRQMGTELMDTKVSLVYSYVHYIIEEIFLKIDERPFANSQERNNLILRCLDVFFLCIQELDLTKAVSFISENEQSIQNQGELNPLELLRLHPGLEIVSQLLRGSRFTQKIFSIVVGDDYESKLRSLEIIQCCLQIQTPFLNVILPAIMEKREDTQLLSSLTGLDSLLSAKSQVILEFFNNVNTEDLVCLTSLRIIGLLAASRIFQSSSSILSRFRNRLVGIIDNSSIRDNILTGFGDRFAAESVENSVEEMVATIPTNSRECIHSVGHCIKLTILELLLNSLQEKEEPKYSLAFYILGLAIDKEESVNRNSCLNVLVTKLMSLQPNQSQPIFTEKCMQLLYVVCSYSNISKSVLRYLRNEHDFFYRQINTFIPVADFELSSGPNQIFIAKLNQCAWLLKLVALELHVAASSGQRSQSQKILSLLFSSVTVNDMWNSDRNLFEVEKTVSQPIIKIIEILQRINFSEKQSPMIDLSGSPFGDINLGEYMTINSRGIELFDSSAIMMVLTWQYNFLLRSNPMMDMSERQRLEDFANDIMTDVALKNRHQETFHGRYHCAQSWITLVRIAVKDYFDLLPFEVREKRLAELLSNLLQHANLPNVSQSIGIIVSHAVLALVARIKQDKETSLSTNSLGSASFELAGSYHTYVLKGIVDGILTPGSSPSMRGNYYSSLITFLTFIKPVEFAIEEPNHEPFSHKDAFYETALLIFKQPQRFWELICRDAVDGELVWRTVAFSILAALCNTMNRYFRATGSNAVHPFLDFLTKRNYLGHYIKMIQEQDDSSLRKIIDKPNDLHDDSVRFCFESKMSFFITLAGSRSGSERLLDFGVLETLTSASFLRAFPRIGSFDDTVLATQASDVFYSITNPVFEMILSIISHFPSGHSGILAKVRKIFTKLKDFFSSNAGVIISMLRITDRIQYSALYQCKIITGIFAWIGNDSPFVNIANPHGSQNTYNSALLDLYKSLSGQKWFAHLMPQNDVESMKAKSISPFVISGSRKSLFVEECLQLSEDICRNILLYYQRAKKSNSVAEFPSQELVIHLKDSVEKATQLSSEIQNLRIKLSEPNSVSIDEINEICRFYNDALFSETSLSQRRYMYLKSVRENLQLLTKKLNTLINAIEIGAMLIKRSGLQATWADVLSAVDRILNSSITTLLDPNSTLLLKILK